MNKRKWKVSVVSVMLILLLLAGYMAVAAEYGSEDDPVVALSYITDVLAPETLAEVNAAIDLKIGEFETELNQKLSEYTQELETTIADFEDRNANIASDTAFIDAVSTSVLARLSAQGDGSVSGAPSQSVSGLGTASWKKVTLDKGQTLTFNDYSTVVLRLGSAKAAGSSNPALVNLTSATTLSSGETIAKNTLYMCTITDNGLTASENNTVVFVLGSYTIQ